MRGISSTIEQHILFEHARADTFEVSNVVEDYTSAVPDIVNVVHIAARARIQTVIDCYFSSPTETGMGQVAADESQASGDENLLSLHCGITIMAGFAHFGLWYPGERISPLDWSSNRL